MTDFPSESEERVLVLMPNERDTERTAVLLSEARLQCTLCSGLSALCSELRAGAGAVLTTDEIIHGDINRQLEVELEQQPAWSALPALVLTRENAAERMPYSALRSYKNVVVVERPVRTRSLVSVVRSALRARRYQYQIRDAMREHERQARELLEHDEKLRFALSAGGLGSWELDIESEQLTCSDICKANYGRPLDQPFSYEELRACIHPEDRERMLASIVHSLRTTELYDVEYRVLWPNGEVHWLLVRGRALYEGQRGPVRMVGVSLDVTERERLHDALRQSEAALAKQADQLRMADRLKDEFLATLAHELRNPLAPISTGLSLLSESPDPELSQRTLGVMQRQVRHMTRLIDDLLDVSRITMGKLELKRERISLASVVDAAIEASQPNLERGQHVLRTQLASEPLFLDADYTRVAQVISNLLNNASKYTPSGGSIELSARGEGDEIVIAVTDNGLGIPKDRLEDVFQMFSQVNRALDRSQGGLGIGLALVRKIVEIHGGSVRASSKGPHQGSTFTVRLPRAAGPPVQASSASAQARPKGGKRILVVDDNHDAADLLSIMLKQAGYETATACDGPTAIEAACALEPHIVILDIGLPGMSGYEVAQRLRSDVRLGNVALIALTGWGNAEDRRKASVAGFDLHLTKPVDAKDLHEALSRAAGLRATSEARHFERSP